MGPKVGPQIGQFDPKSVILKPPKTQSDATPAPIAKKAAIVIYSLPDTFEKDKYNHTFNGKNITLEATPDIQKRKDIFTKILNMKLGKGTINLLKYKGDLNTEFAMLVKVPIHGYNAFMSLSDEDRNKVYALIKEYANDDNKNNFATIIHSQLSTGTPKPVAKPLPVQSTRPIEDILIKIQKIYDNHPLFTTLKTTISTSSSSAAH